MGRPREAPDRLRANLSAPEVGHAHAVGAVWRPGGPEVYEAQTPLAALLAAEGEGAEEVDRAEVYLDFMAYCFGASPHPCHVMRRIYALAEECAPRLLSALPLEERRWLRAEGGVAHLVRVAAVIRGTRIEGRCGFRHDGIINETLRAAAARRRGEVEAMPVLSREGLLAMRAGEELAAYTQRIACVRGLLWFLFCESAAPEIVVRRVFALAMWREATTATVLNMTLHQLGVMFGEVRATWSWRIKHVVVRFLALRNVRATKARFQRSDEACANYARAQAGNHNRRHGAARVA